jgi:hypothetical protein
MIRLASALAAAFVLTAGAAAFGQNTAGPAGPAVPAYGMFETQLSVPNVLDNPYDPDQIAVNGEFTAPSGKKLTVPAFYRVEQVEEVTPGRERLRDMRLLKIYVSPGTWSGGRNLAYILDDVRLVENDGTEIVLGDFEKPDPRWSSSTEGKVQGEIVHSGKGAFRSDFPAASQAAWPGIHMDLTGQDWREGKELRFFLYPLTDHSRGSLDVEFYAGDGDKVQTSFRVGPDGLKPNAWNEVVWTLPHLPDRRLWHPKDAGEFALRFCPAEVGAYRYVVRRAGQEAPVTEGSFQCTPSDRPGLLRVAGPGARYVTFDNGKPLVLVGENMCWPGSAGVSDYDGWLRKLAAVGGNYIRVWMCPWAFGIEWDRLGRYQQDRAQALDYVFALARKLGVHIMLCLDYHGFLVENGGSWGGSPYRAAAGGPCARPQEFMTNAAARALYKKRLRYLVARYGPYDNLLSWEFFNEVELIQDYNSQVVADWHQEMARYLRSIDPYAHILTTSYAGEGGDPRVWSLPEMEYTQLHTYGGLDKAEEVIFWSRHFSRYNKPFLVGEFGVGGGGGESEDRDPTGLEIHNGAWAGVMGGTMGTAMTWWWDYYVENGDMYRHWAPIAKFAGDIPPTARPVLDEDLSLTYADPNRPLTYDDVSISPTQGSWEPATFNTPQTFAVARDGSVANVGNLAQVLHGVRNHPNLHNPATFELDCAQPARFVTVLSGVSGYGGAKLKMSVDGKLLLDKDFPNPGTGTATLAQYDGPYAVDVPAGKHTVKVEDDGNDWCYVSYRVEGYRANVTPNCRAVGISAGGKAWLWVQNRQSNWGFWSRRRTDPTPIPASRLTLAGLPDGAYATEVWNPWTGAVTAGEVRSEGGRLQVVLPGFLRDVALKIRPK